MDVVSDTNQDALERTKRRKIENTASENAVVEIVMTNPVTMITTSSNSSRAVANSPNSNHSNHSNHHGNGASNGAEAGSPGQQSQKERFVAFDNCKTEQIALLTALSQVVSCTQEAVKILRESQERSLDLEHKRFRFQLEAEEKRLMMESEHYRKMENMFSCLIQAISQTPSTAPNTTILETVTEQRTVVSPTITTVKVEVDT